MVIRPSLTAAAVKNVLIHKEMLALSSFIFVSFSILFIYF